MIGHQTLYGNDLSFVYFGFGGQHFDFYGAGVLSSGRRRHQDDQQEQKVHHDGQPIGTYKKKKNKVPDFFGKYMVVLLFQIGRQETLNSRCETF